MKKYFQISPVAITCGIICGLDLFLAVYIYEIREAWVMVLAGIILAYSLTASTLRFIEFEKKNKGKIRTLADIRKRMGLLLSFSWILNILFSVFYLYLGISSDSLWFSALGLFYIALSTARVVLLTEFKNDQPVLRSEYRKYTECGYALLFMTISLLVIAILVINEHQSMEYPGILIYVAAVFSLSLLVSAITGLRKFSKYQSPLLSACKLISVAAAMLGVFSLQTAVLGRYCSDTALTTRLNMASGIILFIIMLIMSIYMIVHGGRKLVEHQY